MRNRKHFIGPFLRQLRTENGLTQAAFAKRLSISTSYLNQLENNQKHVTASILLGLAEEFSVDISTLSNSDGDRLMADLKEALADPVFMGEEPTAHDLRVFAQTMPSMAKAFLNMHQSLRKAGERLAEIDGSLDRSGVLDEPTPFEEVRDFFHYNNNYIDLLDRAGEELAKAIFDEEVDRLHSLIVYMREKHGIRVSILRDIKTAKPIRNYDDQSKTLYLSGLHSRSTHMFQIAHQIARLEHGEAIEKTIRSADFHSEDAEAICRIGLANYFAGATIMPYGVFAKFVETVRHDLQIISRQFETSLEQVAHRLSTLQRPRKKGVPFFFARVDQAGNITKRHSATKLQFARFGSACPLWNAHAAFASPGKLIRQLAETPDGERYLCVAIEVKKPGLSYGDRAQRYALALGCEIEHAGSLVYSDGLDTSNLVNFEPIGISCRICDRNECNQRALPPLKRKLIVEPDNRTSIPYRF